MQHMVPDCTCSGKRCSVCKETQCIEAFHRHKRLPDGRRYQCKACIKAIHSTEEYKARRRDLHKQNADHINEKKREWYQENAEKARKHSQDYRERHPDKIKSYFEEYNRSEQGKLRWQTYRENHPDKVAQFHNAWSENHHDAVLEHAKVRGANYKAKKLGVPGKLTVDQWRELKDFYNNTCLRCLKQEPEITLTPDHIVPFFHRGPNIIDNVQPLCEFCNTSKGIKIIDYRISHEEKNIG